MSWLKTSLVALLPLALGMAACRTKVPEASAVKADPAPGTTTAPETPATPPDYAARAVSMKSLKIFTPIPLIDQGTDYTCGVASLMAVLGYNGDFIMESELAKEVKSDPQNGTAYKNLAGYAEGKGYEVKIEKGMTIDALKAHLLAKRPVIVLIQAWGDKDTDWKKEWGKGHYVVAIGYDDERIYFMDPVWAGSYGYIKTAEFLDRWHDVDVNGTVEEKLEHFGMTMTKAGPKFDIDHVMPID